MVWVKPVYIQFVRQAMQGGAVVTDTVCTIICLEPLFLLKGPRGRNWLGIHHIYFLSFQDPRPPCSSVWPRV